eukprot:g19865.t1
MVEGDHITVSPATSNPNPDFTADYNWVFRGSTVRYAFERHPAFSAVFASDGGRRDGSGRFRSSGSNEEKKKFPGEIVALSTDTEAAATVKGGHALAEKGLISAITTAYNMHCNLVISPDDVWLTILAQFCAYVNKNAEGLRNRIVDHEGMKGLVVSLGDWKLLREKIERLLEFEVDANPQGKVMRTWVGYLRKVCNGFVESAEHPGSPETLEFWDKVVKRQRAGSGGSSITGGWVSAFTCFDAKGNFRGRYMASDEPSSDSSDDNGDIAKKDWDFPMISDQVICHNVVSCPVSIVDVTAGHYDGTLFVGQTVCDAERPGETGHPTVRPRSDWCMAVAVKE